MKWSNGLSQFLELKYRRPLSTESLKAVFISNKRFFKQYGKALYGLTGTLGSQSSCKMLQDVYNIHTVQLPINKAKKYTQHRCRVALNQADWCKEIYTEIEDHRSEQPILVICENLKRLDDLKAHLASRDGDDIEERFEKQEGAHPNDIILATNKGGRGTDIKIDDKKVPHGLHVIVTFLPENTRIEEQAFGRAARKGQAGSGCLVLEVEGYESDIQLFSGSVTATIIEKEKMKRDQAEREHINLLLREGIPQLDLEETLYQLFQGQRKSFEDSLSASESTVLGQEITGKCIKACVAVVTDKWAFWLDSVRDKIHEVDSNEKKQALMEDFQNNFLPQVVCSPTFSDTSILFAMPEHCIHIGQAYMKEAKFQTAQKCFELAISRGDHTGLAAMTACYCYLQTHPKPSKENKNIARRYLKEAKKHLDCLRRGWMANGEIGKSLSDLVDVSQYVATNENYYAEQVQEKLKVIGLHINTVESLIGSSIDETSFINESKLKVERITAGQSKAVYQKLVDKGIICHNRVRKCWRKREILEPLIREEVELRIADKLISLIITGAQSRGSINENDLIDLVYSSDELWGLLRPIMAKTEPVVIIEVSNVKAKLQDDDHEQAWETFKDPLGERMKGDDIPLVLTTDDPILVKLREDKFKKFVTHLKNNALYRETNRAQIIQEDVKEQITLIDLGKYMQCSIKDEMGNEQTMQDFLCDLLSYCQENEGGDFYEYMLPFDKQIAEAKKLHAFLHAQDILKSGMLAKHEYEYDNSDLDSSVETVLGKEYGKEQRVFILNIIYGLRGEIRGFERDMMIGFTDIYELEDAPKDLPGELDYFTTWHLDYFLTIEQKDKGWWDWNAFAVAMLGLAQVIAGVALVTLSAGAAVQFGNALIAEGINDMVYATVAGLTGTFSWKDRAIQKVISVAISIVTAGMGALATIGKTAVKVGSAARYSTFAKTIAKAAGEFVLGTVTGIISDIVLADAQRRVVESIVEWLEETLFNCCSIACTVGCYGCTRKQ